MVSKDNLGDRMKRYEGVTSTRLVSRLPVIMRLDGKAFHTFTKGFEKPFDEVFSLSMRETMKYLCENIQGCLFGYTQSDEITLILVDYKNINSSAWFDYEVQKMCSISASMATMAFNRFFADNCREWFNSIPYADLEKPTEEADRLYNAYTKAFEKGAMFDSRCFNIPKEEVANLIYWRQLDATRNSIQMVGQANFSHKELQGKSCNMIQDMLHEQRGINWNDFPTHKKRGTCVIKCMENPNERPHWIIDTEIPIFRGEGRQYIDELIWVGSCQCRGEMN